MASIVRERNKPDHSTHLQQALGLMPDPSLVTYKNNIIAANDAAVRLFGIERDVLIDKAITTFIEAGKSTNLSLAKSSDNAVLEYTNTLNISDQHARQVLITERTLPYEGDVATLMIIRPQAIQHNAQLLSQMVAQSIDAMVVTDNDVAQGPHIVMMNPTFTKITGYSSEDLLGARLGDVLGEQATPTPLDAIQDGLPTSDVADGIISITSKNGTPLQLAWTLHPIRDDTLAITHYVISHRDVSEQQAIVRNISENEKTFRIVSEMMSDYAYGLRVNDDDTSHIDWVSGDVVASTGLSEESAKKLADWESLVHAEDRSFYNMRQKALISGRTRHLEYRLVRADGITRWVSDSAYPIIDPVTGKVTRILGAVHDVTERVLAQDTLKAHVVQQAVVAELGMLALNTRDTDQLITHASVLCEQVLDIALSVVYGYDPEQHTFECLSVSRDDIAMDVGYTFSDDYLLSLAGHTLYTNEAVISKDLADELLFKPLEPIREAGYGSGLGVIIFGSDAPFGVLAVYSEHIQDFTQEEIYFVQAIANVMGTFVERNRAQEAEIEQAEFADALRDATAIINSNLDLPDVLGK
ncbi:MAG: PAS domain S-box protein, partial [Chloroflexota bacterium]